MLIDEVDLKIIGGHGGAGKVSFGPGKHSGPDGGDGGRGGAVYIKVVNDLFVLNQFSRTKEVKAENGENGGSKDQVGKNAPDKEINLCVGTELLNKRTEEIIKLDNLGEKILICKGGLGGRGNAFFAAADNTTPRFAQKGLNGQERNFKISLKLIADFGLIGLPNAGKSSLLNELTNANAKVANYSFTTLEPNLGVLNKKVIADIPGLIEGASSGKGLGIKFLKHIEKVKLLLHCISAESADIKKDYQIIRKELGDFDQKLLDKKEIILLTKTDLVSEKEAKSKLKIIQKLNSDSLPISIHDFDSLEKLKKQLLS